jgi:tetratricopeptide (TPR) repeat protein
MSSEPATLEAARQLAASARSLGDRVRALRLARGLTQTDLAGARFTKEYVSQIERGKTRPTAETVSWLAEQLDVDVEFLVRGVAADVRDRVEAILARAEALSADHRYDDAVEGFREARTAMASVGSAQLEVRALAGEGWARMQRGDVREAIDVLQVARALTELDQFTDVERADVLFRLGCCRYKLSSIATAVALFDEAQLLAERSELPSDRVRAQILSWRSRCRRRQRDFEAAREDAELALELARSADDPRIAAGALFQASFVAEKQGQLIAARQYAQQARQIYEQLEDERNLGRIMLNIGGLQLLLGHAEQAIEHLNASFALAVEAGSQPDAAQALGSLAAVHLQLGDYGSADEHARKALDLLDGREDFLDEVGQSSLVLGRSLLERGRLDEAEEQFRAADAAFEQMASVGHRAGVWVALGDLAERRGDEREAARHYRNAAEALRVVHF